MSWKVLRKANSDNSQCNQCHQGSGCYLYYTCKFDICSEGNYNQCTTCNSGSFLYSNTGGERINPCPNDFWGGIIPQLTNTCQQPKPVRKGAQQICSNLDRRPPPLPNQAKTSIQIAEHELENKKVEITGKKAVHDIGWLRINVQPLKERLGIKVQTWMKVYTGFLYKQVKLIVANIKSFNKTIEDGIKKNPINDQEDNELLMSVMKTISQVKLVDNDNIVNVVNRIKAIVGVLKKNAIPMDDDYITVIDTIFSNFKDISSRVYNIKCDILPLQTKMQDNLKLQTEQFRNFVQNLRTKFTRVLPYSYAENLSI